jgi:uncharacterized protein YlxW (UPF0749 family)
MEQWKVELDALIVDTTAYVRSLGAAGPLARGFEMAKPVSANVLTPAVIQTALQERSRVKSEREEIRQRVNDFRAHQARLAREREEYANSVLRMIVPRPD